MVKRMVELTSSASKVYGVVNNNDNPYKNMVMDAMRVNQGNVSHYPNIEEEPNADAIRFFLSFERF